MKLNSKSGATLAAAAAMLFLAGTVATVSTPAHAARGKCSLANICKGRDVCQGRKGKQRGAKLKAACIKAHGKYKHG